MRLHTSTDLPLTRPVDRVLVVLVVALVATLLPPTAPAARADARLESQLVAATNQARAAAGLPALAVASDLASGARAHSRVMADTGHLHHDPDITSMFGGWRKIGDNVARGPSVSSVHSTLMTSPGHRRNILDPDDTHVGMGVVVDGIGQLWVTQVFGRTGEVPPPPPPPPAPEPEPAPQPAPAPGPAPQPAPEPGPTGAPAAVPTADPEPEPYEVAIPPVALDRMTLVLAQQVAAETGQRLAEVLDELRSS